MLSYKNHAKKYLENEEKKLKEKLKEIQKAKKGLEKPLLFNVSIRSFWGDYGEKNVVSDLCKKPEVAIKQACEKFKTENNRSDIQGKPLLWVVLENMDIPIPEQRWKKIFDKWHEISIKKEKRNGNRPWTYF